MKSSFVDYVVEDLLNGIEGIRAKAMFGGYGIYKNDTIFGIIVDEELYYKVDDSNRRDYEKYKSEPFQYTAKDNKKVSMSYWKLPSEVMDDREQLQEWTLCSIKINSKSKKARKS